MVENILTLGMLIMLQAVLGFDNLLYISLESKKVKPEEQKRVRAIGIGLAIVLRIILLFALISLIQYFQDPILVLHSALFETSMNVHSLIFLLGGIFIIYTAVKEIWHMMALDTDQHLSQNTQKKSAGSAIAMIVLMNLVFSFDSILSAMALTEVFWVLATAIIISGVLMIWLSDHVANFLQKNRMYEVLGLFVLFIVGIMLISEGGHLAHMSILGNPITQMSKTTFYFILFILVIIDVVQGRYQKKIAQELEKNETLS